LRHQVNDRPTAHPDKGFIHQKVCLGIAPQQPRQRAHLKRSAIGIVRVHDHHEACAGWYLQIIQVKSEAEFGGKKGFRIFPGNLREQGPGRGE
jgi:hypothetical protein